jgi:zinc transport system permease protein
VLVSLACGAVGSLVVGGRMAFFSDALVHCAFASVSIAFVLVIFLLPALDSTNEFWDWVTPIMLVLGMVTAYGIAYVRERTGLADDTVIGIFFAFAIGLAATLRKIIQSRRLFTLEDFLFGDPLTMLSKDIVWLAGLVLLVGVTMAFIFNSLLLTRFSTSLALSRQVRGRLASYVFIVLLALVVNLCIRTVGAMLISALLIVPAATACNLTRNLRQLFWCTIVLCLAASLSGPLVTWEIDVLGGPSLAVPGTVILISVGLFVVSAFVGPWLRRAPRPSPAAPTAEPPT